MTMAISSCSPLRTSSRDSIAACASAIDARGRRPGLGRTSARSCAQLASGQFEEDVFEGSPLDGQRIRQDAEPRSHSATADSVCGVSCPTTR